MQVSAYTIFSKNELTHIHSGLENLLAIWGEKWLIEMPPALSVHSVNNAYEAANSVPDSDKTETSIERQSTNGKCQLQFSTGMLQRIYRFATGDNTPKGISSKTTSSAEARLTTKILEDLLDTILSGSEPGSNATGYHIAQPSDSTEIDLSMKQGSGTVIATITDQDTAMRLVLSESLAKHLAGRMSPKKERVNLTSRKSVIGHGNLKVQVTAGEIELRLSDLLGLLPGHVLRLNLKKNQPFILETTDTQTKICDAYLGQRDGHKAIQLINP
jgi:hypothetical protein